MTYESIHIGICPSTSKLQYKSKADANFAKPENWRTYHCPFCHNWHFTKQPRDKNRKKRNP